MTDFFPQEHISISNKRTFGLCDATANSGNPAFLAEDNGNDWIAVVHNDRQEKISFVPIDNCIELLREDGKIDNRCDCCLFYNTTIIFVELKQKNEKKDRNWINKGEEQLRSTIFHFEQEEQSQAFNVKKAYIANSCKPHFRKTQIGRMQKFFKETGYSLRIESHIKNL
ncbi:hypothetical protein [Prevotella intermedia]|uniref:Uncharacterized protein n=1 Tax=Prevotella intermedia TaxID=28131 RepID=A0A2G9IDJ5_PREIN|nr:hypothetical protein [Prevotella intermedia]PIN27803.1 hypothetical protein CUC04_10835 [Prevotella intermedia]